MKKLLIGLALISLFSCKEKCVECYVTTYVGNTNPQGIIYEVEFCGTSKEIKNFERYDTQQRIICQ